MTIHIWITLCTLNYNSEGILGAEQIRGDPKGNTSGNNESEFKGSIEIDVEGNMKS